MTFESVARHQSFARAGDEVALSQSAVCKQVCRLESFLGQPLFNRVSRRLVLTEVGAAYARQVRDVLERLERDALNVMTLQETTGKLSVAVAPAFSTRWLIPRLPLFSKREPDVIVNIGARMTTFEFASSPFEAAIHFGDATWPGAVSQFLLGEELIPVCAPMLLGGARRLHPREFGCFSLLHQPSRQSSWARWFDQVGVVGVNAMKGPRYELSEMLVEAAVAGMGLALAPRLFVQEELASGRLVNPCSVTLRSESAYYLVYPQDRVPSKALESFKTWLLDAAASCNDKLQSAAKIGLEAA